MSEYCNGCMNDESDGPLTKVDGEYLCGYCWGGDAETEGDNGYYDWDEVELKSRGYLNEEE